MLGGGNSEIVLLDEKLGTRVVFQVSLREVE